MITLIILIVADFQICGRVNSFQFELIMNMNLIGALSAINFSSETLCLIGSSEVYNYLKRYVQCIWQDISRLQYIGICITIELINLRFNKIIP